MSVVFSEGTNMPEPGATRHKLRRCALCGSNFVSRNENSEICDTCRTRELQKADQSLDAGASAETSTSGGMRRVRLSLNDVAGESSNAELPAKPVTAKTQWRSPPFKIQFEETAKEEPSDLFPAQPPPGRFVRLRSKLALGMATVLICAGVWTSRYGVPEIVRQFAQRAFATRPLEQQWVPPPEQPRSVRRPTF